MWVSLLCSRHLGMRKGDVTHPEGPEGTQGAGSECPEAACGVEAHAPYRGDGRGGGVQPSILLL